MLIMSAVSREEMSRIVKLGLVIFIVFYIFDFRAADVVSIKMNYQAKSRPENGKKGDIYGTFVDVYSIEFAGLSVDGLKRQKQTSAAVATF